MHMLYLQFGFDSWPTCLMYVGVFSDSTPYNPIVIVAMILWRAVITIVAYIYLQPICAWHILSHLILSKYLLSSSLKEEIEALRS